MLFVCFFLIAGLGENAARKRHQRLITMMAWLPEFLAQNGKSTSEPPSARGHVRTCQRDVTAAAVVVLPLALLRYCTSKPSRNRDKS